MRIDIPDPVNYILKKLNAAGHEAYAVGGCVRDALLGREPNDWDITTSALPSQVKEVFHRTIDTGIRHGTVTVLLREGQFEVTTYRIDGIYEDSRHPKEVTFTAKLTEDLRRRDFTINAMAYHPSVGTVDPYGGLRDLSEGVIRAVGVPAERFDEDALRIMRAVRFSAQLGFAIDPGTYLALRDFAPRLELISRERIRDELIKLITSPYPETFEVLYDTGITKVIFPRFDEMMACPQNRPSHKYNVGLHTLAVMQSVPPTVRLRLAALLHDSAKPEVRTVNDRGWDVFTGHHTAGAAFAEKWLREMRLDNATIADVCTLIRYHDFLFPKDEAGVRHAMNLVGDLFDDLLLLMKADSEAKSDEGKAWHLPVVEQIGTLYHAIKERGDCVDMKHLAVTGGDLIRLGINPGPGMGEVLNTLLDEVLDDPAKNDREYLLCEAAHLASEIHSKG
ncbi:MAG: HD domain-containing protein [Lachnospiraceae bacterium]|nr:HD domain-containing protein [Lachnospiraceae bacterium]